MIVAKKQIAIGRAELAARLDISPRWASTLVHAGIPHRKLRDGNTVFLWPAALAWWIERCVKQRDAKAKPATKDALELRKLEAQARLVEMDVEQRAGNLVTVDYMSAQVNATMQRLRSKLLVMPGKLAPELVGMQTIDDALEVVERGVNECMQALAATGEDVDPDEGAEDAPTA